MRKVKRRALGEKNNTGGVKTYPDIDVMGPLSVQQETKPAVSSISGQGEELASIKKYQERIKFFDEFFSDDNKMPLGRVMVYCDSFPRKYAVARFDYGKFKTNNTYLFAPFSMPIPMEGDDNGLEDYFRYLYVSLVENVEYFEGIADEEFQAMIKALFICKDLVIAKRDSIVCLTDQKNRLYWLEKDIVPSISMEYLETIKARYEKATDGKINQPDFESLYMYFKENPNPDMKVLKLEEASSNPFKFL